MACSRLNFLRKFTTVSPFLPRVSGHNSLRCLTTTTAAMADMKLTPIEPQSVTIKVEGKDDVSMLSGVPAEQLNSRTVRIYSPAKSAMQSGTHTTRNWRIEFDTRERWENPLMGWTSSADPLSMIDVQFSSKDEAVEYCERNGWAYEVDEKREINLRPKSYGANFSWNKKTRVSTK